MIDLWPELSVAEKIKAPISIFREQASLLGQKTKNLVTAEVEKPRKYDERFNYSFDLVAPTLDNYHYRLFTVEHGIDLYPLRLYLDTDIIEELKNQISINADADGYFVSAENEDELIKQLRLVFGSKRTRHLVKALLAQAEPASQLKIIAPPAPPSDDIPF